VKTLIALLPESAIFIRRWLKKSEGGAVAEVHFTLFCFLDAVQDMSSATAFRREVPKLAFEYLRTVKSWRAHAAWMAAHLLGGHWNARESLRILLEVVKAGRFVAGRGAAVMGLQELHQRKDVPRTDKQRIVAALDEVGRVDRSRQVRARASRRPAKAGRYRG
jgi:hypothetical protein